MTDIKRIGTTGIHTVEGNVAGARAARLTKQRDVQKAEYESIKNKIKEQNASQVGKIDDKFNTGSDILEQEFRKRTVGLVSASDFRKAREVLDENQKQLQLKQEEEDNEIKELELEKKAKQKEKERQLKRKKISATLSFNIDQEDNDDISTTLNNDTLTEPILKKRLTKDPTIDTTFLPDRERDAKIEAERKRLQKEWLEDQEKIKNEMLEVTYSYWDGSGHRKSVEVSQ